MSGTSSESGIQLLEDDARRKKQRKSRPEGPIAQILPETYWATSFLYLKFQKTYVSTWESASEETFDFEDMERKSPSIDSGRGTRNSDNTDSLRRNRHASMDSAHSSSTTSSLLNFPNERSEDSETTVTVVETDRDKGSASSTVLVKKSRVPSFLRRSKKSLPEDDTSSAPASPVKTRKSPFSVVKRSLFHKKEKYMADGDSKSMTGSNLSLASSRSEQQQLGNVITKATSMSSLCFGSKDKEPKASPSKRLSLVKSLTKKIKGATSAGGKDKGGDLSGMETLSGTELKHGRICPFAPPRYVGLKLELE